VWGLNEDARGKGYATEASAAVIKWVHEQPGVVTVTATIPTHNYASQRLAARLGFSRTRDIRGDLPVWRLDRHSVNTEKSAGHDPDE
jgi:RimJ/RimL family protein N-acetyltransferase